MPCHSVSWRVVSCREAALFPFKENSQTLVLRCSNLFRLLNCARARALLAPALNRIAYFCRIIIESCLAVVVRPFLFLLVAAVLCINHLIQRQCNKNGGSGGIAVPNRHKSGQPVVQTKIFKNRPSYLVVFRPFVRLSVCRMTVQNVHAERRKTTHTMTSLQKISYQNRIESNRRIPLFRFLTKGNVRQIYLLINQCSIAASL